MIHEQVKKDIIVAMKERAQLRLDTLRSTVTAFNNFIIEEGKPKETILDDESSITILRRLVKQRNEAALAYRTAGDEENALKEDKERSILETYLPPELDEEEVRTIVEKVKGELGVSEKKDRGLLMKTAMQELKGKVSGSVVASVVDSVLD